MKPDACSTAQHRLLPGADFLRFVVDFVQRDLAGMRPGAWMDFTADFQLYLGQASLIGASGNCILAHPTPDPVLPCATTFPLPAAYTLQDFEVLQQQLLPLVQAEVAGIPAGTFPTVAEVHVPHGLDRSTPGKRQLVITGDTASCAIKMFLWLMAQEPPERLLACPECSRFFYRFKLQAYCSRKCGNRLVVRNYRARHAGSDTAALVT
jgi:hypothetical protein